MNITVQEEMAKFAVTRLDGDALTWWRRQCRLPGWDLGTVKYKHLVKGLNDAFEDVDRLLRLRRKLNTMRQTGSVRGYVQAFRKLILDMGADAPALDAQQFAFTEGLKPHIHEKVLLARVTTLVAAEQVAERAEQTSRSAQAHKKGYISDGNPTATPMELGQTEQQPAPPRQARRDITCYNCGGKGHIARFCRKPRKDQQFRAQVAYPPPPESQPKNDKARP